MRNKVLRKILIVGIIALFIGTTAFSGAVTTEENTIDPQIPAVAPYPLAVIKLIDGVVDYQGPDPLFDFPIQFPDPESRYIIATDLIVHVNQGNFRIGGPIRQTPIIENGGTVKMKLFVGSVTQEDESTYTHFYGIAVWVTIEWPS